MEALAAIERRVVPTENGLLLAKGTLIGGDVEVIDGARGDEGLVGKADEGGVEFGIGAEGGVVGGLGESDAAGGFKGRSSLVHEIDETEVREAVFALDEHEVSAEGGDAGEHHAGAIGDRFVPAGAHRIDGGRGHEAESAAVVVGANKEDAASRVGGAAGMMVDVVFVIVPAGVDELEATRGAIGAEIVDFAGDVAVGEEEEVGPTAAALDINAEALVVFFEEKRVGAVGIKDVAEELVGALGDFVFDDIEEGAIVGGPGGGGDTLDAEGEEFVGAEILDFEGVLAEAGGVGGVGEEVVVVTDFEDAKA